ncbi:MAG TPA: hypothetical protein VGG19_17945 [Tepidisphaeraceae bacterium]|jgi:hypothetical protein
MKTAARHVILITIVTAVLCADRALYALPAVNQTVTQVASRVASKLATNFRRNTRDYRSSQCSGRDSVQVATSWTVIRTSGIDHDTFSPFQYRLPPPAL